jgi:hypothetical protein
MAYGYSMQCGSMGCGTTSLWRGFGLCWCILLANFLAMDFQAVPAVQPGLSGSVSPGTEPPT